MSYRNRFVCEVGHDDYADWVQMVRDGHATMRNRSVTGKTLFWLTVPGMKLALDPREKLDPRDFTTENELCMLKNRLSDGPIPTGSGVGK